LKISPPYKIPDAPKDKFMRHIRWLKGGRITIKKIHAEFETSDKGVGPNRVWYKLRKYVKPQKGGKDKWQLRQTVNLSQDGLKNGILRVAKVTDHLMIGSGSCLNLMNEQ
jgi:hypothetical protein